MSFWTRPLIAVVVPCCVTLASVVSFPARLVAQSAPAPASAPAPQPYLSVPTDDPFFTTNHIDWPGPNRFRSSNGTPGPDYWQQRADYTIAATLDTTSRQISGTVQVTYTNNSPDTLTYVWMQLDQNLFKDGSQGSRMYASETRWGVRGFDGGYTITDLRVNGMLATPSVNGTMMRVPLPDPLPPRGKKITIAMHYAYHVPDYGADRAARDGTLYQVAQWYPRMAVYDDVRGWNTDQYLGQGEFYLEYGDIDFKITAPAGYTIAASGVLQNPLQVLTSTQRTRLATAARSASVVQIITDAEAKAVPTPGTKMWHFLAKNVRDVAWAGAPDFRWDATSWNGIICQAYYQADKAGSAWEHAAEQTQFTIKTYSELFFRDPYPQATTVAGPVNGMEYPMFVMVRYATPANDPTAIFGTVDHEHGHNWFPMIVGSNERRYAWQDEGFNTYINTFSNERRYVGTPRGAQVFPMYMTNWRTTRERGFDVPLMTMPDHIGLQALGAVGYRKPAVVLLTLRNHVVGKENFDAAFRSYIKAWAFKHPTPGDFFRHIENYTGMDLSWYWRNFWYTNNVLDLAVDSVTHGQDKNGPFAAVAVRNVTGVPFPVILRVKYQSGKTADFTYPVDVWSEGRSFQARVSEEAGAVVGVRLFPDPSVPDWDLSNNTWGDAPPADPLGPVTL